MLHRKKGVSVPADLQIERLSFFYLGGSSAITRVLKVEEGNRRLRVKRKCSHKSQTQRDTTVLALMVEEEASEPNNMDSL